MQEGLAAERKRVWTARLGGELVSGKDRTAEGAQAVDLCENRGSGETRGTGKVGREGRIDSKGAQGDRQVSKKKREIAESSAARKKVPAERVDLAGSNGPSP